MIVQMLTLESQQARSVAIDELGALHALPPLTAVLVGPEQPAE